MGGAAAAENFDKLKLIAYAKLKNGPVSEELAQETFLTALRDFETLRRHENPEAYLRAVLKYIINLERPQCFSAIAPAVPAGMGTVPRIFPPAVKPEVSLAQSRRPSPKSREKEQTALPK